ncbi:putative DNA-binding domain-containing protein [Quatrionicoccus australiensis]|nr:putative DNA-binding domain-containing protein [Quatrionicoccus australiensis]
MNADFQTFQRDLAAHLRAPRQASRPAGVPARRAGVYRELVFNKLCSFLDPCFPLARQLLGEPRWRRLCRSFLRDWHLHTPWFREIPGEFVRYLGEATIRQPLPAWLAELAHYEWAELAVDVMETGKITANPAGDLMDAVIVLNPALLNLAYRWPVQHIGPDYRPRRAQPTHLVVYCAADDAVRFSEISPLTARLLELLADEATSGRRLLLRLADEIGHPQPELLLSYGRELLTELRGQGILLGSHT